MKVILLRHGQSQWNLENRFTGWKDVSLTDAGIQEAKFSGNTLLENNYNIKHVHTSLLNRAIETANIVADIIKFPYEKIQFDWRLNERHYGALQGLNKSETALKYGEKQVKIWRRSYDTPPPLLNDNDERHPKHNKKFKNLNCTLPKGESLKDVINRLDPFLRDYFNNIRHDSDYLIVAHSNSLRAIIKVIEGLSDEEIISVNIPTGIPLVYNLDNSLKIIDKMYLIDQDELKKKLDIVKNQGKIQ
jgi:2,3-bisphosphoglycerate-dependent phosphoglycerate mutase